MYSLLEMISHRKPKIFSVKLDGTEIFRGKFTTSGIQTLLDLPIDLNKPRWLMTIFFDDNPTPVHSIDLKGETGS